MRVVATELAYLDQPLPYHLQRLSSGEWMAAFSVGENQDLIVATLLASSYPGIGTTWSLQFSRNDRLSLGGGDAVQVFSTLTAAVADWAQRVKPEYLWFTGVGAKRKKFYDRWAPRLAKAIGMHQITDPKHPLMQQLLADYDPGAHVWALQR